MSKFFQQFQPKPKKHKSAYDPRELRLMKEVFVLDVTPKVVNTKNYIESFAASPNILFRQYDYDKYYDEIAKKYACEKEMLPWMIEDIPWKNNNGITKTNS